MSRSPARTPQEPPAPSPATAEDPFVLLLMPGHPIWDVTAQAIFQQAWASGYAGAVDKHPGMFPPAFSFDGCQGVIGAIWGRSVLEERERLLVSGRLPVINLSNSRGPVPRMGNFLSDDEAVGRLAAGHLCSRGYRSLLVLGHRGTTYSVDRLAGVRQAVATSWPDATVLDREIAFPRGDTFRNPSSFRHAAAATLRPILAELPDGAAVFAVSDWLAQLVQGAIAEYFPERLHTTAILGVDNVPPDSYHGRLPELSSIEPGFAAQGREAFRWILEHPGADTSINPPLRRFPPVRVVERASTAGPACADPGTARLARWAWTQQRRGHPVEVADLARRQRVNRKTIMRWFGSHLGMSPSDYLEQVRLDHARELLRDTRLPILEVSHRCGYAKQDVLSRAIRRAEDCTPVEYRARHAR